MKRRKGDARRTLYSYWKKFTARYVIIDKSEPNTRQRRRYAARMAAKVAAQKQRKQDRLTRQKARLANKRARAQAAKAA